MIPNFGSDGLSGVQTNSFFYQTIPTWNKLPKDVAEAKTVKVSKKDSTLHGVNTRKDSTQDNCKIRIVTISSRGPRAPRTLLHYNYFLALITPCTSCCIIP
eukprot:TCONS_00047238-protein